MTLPRVLLLTDRHQLPVGRCLVDLVSRCVDVGLRSVVLRELDLPAHRRDDLSDRLADTGVEVLAARRPCRRATALHLAAAQPLLPLGGTPFGRSCHDLDDVRGAAREGAAWLTVSPVAASRSKPGYGPAIGAAGVRRAVAAAGGVPVLALGGVDAVNAAPMRRAGAHGVAVMGAVMRAADPADVFARILAATHLDGADR